MPRNIDLSLEELLVDLEYEHSHGNTEPSILNGLYGNLTFHPWRGFRGIMEEAMEAIDAHSYEDLEEARKSLYHARKFISRSRMKHKKSLQREAEREVLYSSHTGDDFLNASQTVDRTKEASTAGCFTENQSQPKKLKHNPWHERKPVTNSTSISRLHYHILETVGDILDIMYPNEDLELQQRSISCGNLFASSSDKMIREFMRQFVKKTEPSPGAPSTNSKNENDKNDGISIGSGEDSKTMDVITPVRRSKRLKNASRLDSLIECEEPTHPSVQGDESEHAEKDREQIPVRPVIPLNQTPDQALFRSTIEEAPLIPVCCYEFKGPTLDLSGVNPVTSQAASTVSTHNASFTGNTVPNASTYPSNYPRQPSSNSEQAATDTGRQLAHQVEGNTNIEDDIYISGATAKDVAASYQELFSIPPSMRPRGKQTDARLVVLPIAQVISQAMLSQSGCVLLTNHQTTYALQVVEDTDTTEFKAKVFVTGAIPSNQELGQVAAFVGFTKYCLDKVADSDRDALLDPMRRLIMGFSHKAYSAPISKDRLDPMWCPGDRPNIARGTSSGGGRARSGDVGVEPHSSECEKENCTPEAADRTSKATCDMPDSKRMQKDISCIYNTLSFTLYGAAAAKLTTRSKMDEKLMMMFASSKGHVASGASGNVIRAVWEGFDVAVKLWNGHKLDGFLNLRREIKTYKKLQSNSKVLLGSAVPRFLLGWDRPDENSVYRKELILVTEFVGSAIHRNRCGSLYLLSDDGTVLVNKWEEPRICKAALSSLRELHSMGFIHGDIALRNMQVSRRSGSEYGWKVWWLDLGNAFEAHSAASAAFSRVEERQCQAIFGMLDKADDSLHEISL